MKIGVSIEGSMLEEIDRVARKLCVSRSRLVTLALKDYLRGHRNREVTEKLDLVHSKPPGSRQIELIASIKRKFLSTIEDRWSD
jgi:hypothetical protein